MKNQVYLLLILGFSLIPGHDAVAQDHTDQVIEQMKTFSWMTGQWQGEAWYIGADRTKTILTQNEDVTYRLKGTIITMEGTGSQEDEDSGEMITLFKAFGILTWDGEKAKYMLRAYRDGNYIDSELVPNQDGSYSWLIEIPYGKTRYTLRHKEDGAWNEKGEFSPAGGENWMQIFEMTLYRK